MGKRQRQEEHDKEAERLAAFYQEKLPFRFRQSTLETARCLYRFKKVHLDGVREPESEANERGTDFHALAKRYVDYLISAKEEMEWSYADELIESGSYSHEAVAIFKQWAIGRTFRPNDIFATELKLSLDADYKPTDRANGVFTGDLDLVEFVDRHAVITDYKTHWAVFDPTSIQSVFYPWLLWKQFPHFDSIRFNLEFVRWGTTRSRDFTKDQLQHMDRYIRAHVDRVMEAWDKEEWPAAVNSQCAYCRLECPLIAAGMSRESIGQVGSDQQAAQMARQMFALQRAYKQMHTALRNYAALHGPIDAGNEIRLGFAKQDKMTYDVDTIVDLNDEYGFDEHRCLNVASREVAKIGKNYPEYVRKAQETATDRSSTKFKFWSQNGDPLEQEDDDVMD